MFHIPPEEYAAFDDLVRAACGEPKYPFLSDGYLVLNYRMPGDAEENQEVFFVLVNAPKQRYLPKILREIAVSGGSGELIFECFPHDLRGGRRDYWLGDIVGMMADKVIIDLCGLPGMVEL